MRDPPTPGVRVAAQNEKRTEPRGASIAQTCSAHGRAERPHLPGPAPDVGRRAAPQARARPCRGGARRRRSTTPCRRARTRCCRWSASAARPAAIAALQSFFSATPADGGMAYVVVMHLSPEHESTLAQILQRTTPMPVQQVQRHGAGRGRPRLRHPARQDAVVGERPPDAAPTSRPTAAAASPSTCSSAPWPTPTARTRRRSCCRAPTATARSASSASRSAAA